MHRLTCLLFTTREPRQAPGTAVPLSLCPAVCAVPLPKQQYRYLDIKADELRGTFKSDVESEQRLLYYGQLDRMRHISLEPSAPQVTHHRQVKIPCKACHS